VGAIRHTRTCRSSDRRPRRRFAAPDADARTRSRCSSTRRAPLPATSSSSPRLRSSRYSPTESIPVSPCGCQRKKRLAYLEHLAYLSQLAIDSAYAGIPHGVEVPVRGTRGSWGYGGSRGPSGELVCFERLTEPGKSGLSRWKQRTSLGLRLPCGGYWEPVGGLRGPASREVRGSIGVRRPSKSLILKDLPCFGLTPLFSTTYRAFAVLIFSVRVSR
jgi:hypothetical protein